jgi:anti-sigma regulatory factor (Ser/Thr protein kinase)
MPSWSRLFPGRPEQIAHARLFIRSVLAGRDEAESAELVVSELATNAVRHSASGLPGGAFTVRVTLRPDGVTVAVDDLGSAGEPSIRGGSDELPMSGLGLVLVATLAKEWGSTRTGSGRRVWAELSGSDAAGAA